MPERVIFLANKRLEHNMEHKFVMNCGLVRYNKTPTSAGEGVNRMVLDWLYCRPVWRDAMSRLPHSPVNIRSLDLFQSVCHSYSKWNLFTLQFCCFVAGRDCFQWEQLNRYFNYFCCCNLKIQCAQQRQEGVHYDRLPFSQLFGRQNQSFQYWPN